MMTTLSTKEPQRIHPHKFTLWVAMGSIVMVFAALTSAYIVKKNQSSWLEINLPVIFSYSTALIIISSVTMILSLKAFKAREMRRYRVLITLTALLGTGFVLCQWLGFRELQLNNVALIGPKSNSAASFLFVITLIHIVHVLGGIVALLIIFFRAYSLKVKNYSSLPIELLGTYWHFVGAIWIYLFIFYQWIG